MASHNPCIWAAGPPKFCAAVELFRTGIWLKNPPKNGESFCSLIERVSQALNILNLLSFRGALRAEESLFAAFKSKSDSLLRSEWKKTTGCLIYGPCAA